MVNTAGIDSPYSLYEAYNQITRLFNKQEVRIYASPTWNKGDANTMWPYYLLSINAKCKSKADAFAFIKRMLSDEFQQQAGKDDPNWYTPVNERAYNLDKIRANVGSGKLYENEVYKIIEEEMPEFLNGNKSAGGTAKTIDDRITIYLNE